MFAGREREQLARIDRGVEKIVKRQAGFPLFRAVAAVLATLALLAYGASQYHTDELLRSIAWRLEAIDNDIVHVDQRLGDLMLDAKAHEAAFDQHAKNTDTQLKTLRASCDTLAVELGKQAAVTKSLRSTLDAFPDSVHGQFAELSVRIDKLSNMPPPVVPPPVIEQCACPARAVTCSCQCGDLPCPVEVPGEQDRDDPDQAAPCEQVVKLPADRSAQKQNRTRPVRRWFRRGR